MARVRLTVLRIASALLLALVAASLAWGQITTVNDMTSVPVPGSGREYIHLLNETVNPANGSLSVRIQVPMPAGRGISIPFGFSYDSNTAILGSNTASRGGWSYTIPMLTLTYETRDIEDINGPVSCGYIANYMFTDFSGVRHPLDIGLDLNYQA